MKRRKRLKLVIRFLVAERDHALLLGVICIFAIAFSLLFSQSSRAQGERLRERIEYLFGTVSVLPIVDHGLVPYPHVSHLANQQPGWLSEASVEETRLAAAELGLRSYPRLRGGLFVAGDQIAPFVAVSRDDPARAWIEERAAGSRRLNRASRSDEIEEGAPLTLAVQYTDAAVSTLAVPVDAIIGRDEDGRVWLQAEWLWSELASRGRLPAISAPGLAAPIRPPTQAILASEMVLLVPDEARHFELAFELAQALDAQAVEVLPWPARLGSTQYGRITARAPTARVLLLAVTALTLAGATSIAVRRRVAISTALRVVGVSEQELRGIYVAEISVVAILSALIVWAGVAALVGVFGITVARPMLRNTLLIGVVVPMGAGFFAARRQLRAPITSMREEVVE